MAQVTVPGSSGGDIVDGLHDAMEGGVCTDGHVGATEVIVYGAHHAHNVQVAALICLVLVDLT